MRSLEDGSSAAPLFRGLIVLAGMDYSLVDHELVVVLLGEFLSCSGNHGVDEPQLIVELAISDETKDDFSFEIEYAILPNEVQLIGQESFDGAVRQRLMWHGAEVSPDGSIDKLYSFLLESANPEN